MKKKSLPNYIRSHRKRLSLSQNQVSHLIGGTTGDRISRYEHFERAPSLEAALALSILLDEPVHELFGGLYQVQRSQVRRRARNALRATGRQPHTNSAQVEALLKHLSDSPEHHSR
jgi:transcriptional regulator with XRE-family HTH domain